MNNFYQIIDI